MKEREMKRVLVFALSLVFTLSMISLAFAGGISGKVLHKDGSPCSSCQVSASVKSGGVTKRVSCNSKGEFSLSWSADIGVNAVYVNGNKRHGSANNGSYLTLTK